MKKKIIDPNNDDKYAPFFFSTDEMREYHQLRVKMILKTEKSVESEIVLKRTTMQNDHGKKAHYCVALKFDNFVETDTSFIIEGFNIDDENLTILVNFSFFQTFRDLKKIKTYDILTVFGAKMYGAGTFTATNISTSSSRHKE